MLRQEDSELPHHVEHIVAKKHGGTDDPDNLALACGHCNLHKGPNLTGIDPETRELVPLFHPRSDRWHDHFAWRGAQISGLTARGRSTIEVLAMNDGRRLELRQELLALGELD